MQVKLRYRFRKLLWPAVFAAQLLLASALPALDVPLLRGRVNDLADMISSPAEAQLDARLQALEASDSTQVVVLTMPSLEGEVLEEYSLRVAETWGIGRKEYDNGALLLVSMNNRKVRIEVGYGLEGVLTDLLSGRIIDHVIVPNFKAGRFDEGFIMGVDAITQAVRGEYEGKGEVSSAGSRKILRGRANLLPLFILVIIISMLGARRRIFGAVAGALLLPLVAWFSLSLSLYMILLMVPLGFLGGLALPGMYLFWGGSRSRFYGGGGFSSGGGGFSGGGGGFGGGGASGSW
ncbi:hypothetical protein ES703_29731 [subsurface metagenome]